MIETTRPFERGVQARVAPVATRRGFALVLVCVFVVLFLGLLGVAWRQVAAMVRIQRVVEIRKHGDQGSVRVMAIAMQVLETGLVWNKAEGTAEIRLSDSDYRSPSDGAFSCRKYYNAACESATADWHYYKVTFTPQNTTGTIWTVKVALSDESGTYGLPDFPSSPP